MSYVGEIKNGVVVLEQGNRIPEGTRVRVEIVEDQRRLTLAERLKDVIGVVEGLPPDFAENHDHYLHGQRKK